MVGQDKVNDFVVKFANVNGTGSASANLLFTKAIFRMGLYVSPKNFFPSNIQGLPTWYEVRVNDKGYLGRRDGVDLMVAVNAQSLLADIKSVKPGGYVLYDSTKPLYSEFIREDVHYIGIPLMEMCNMEFTDPRQRQLFKNIMYVGALSALLDIEFSVLEQLISDQFKGKEKLIAPNIKSLTLGAEYIKAHYKYPLDIRVERRNLTDNMIMMEGNAACGLGAVYGGATFAAWYPITPSTSVAEAFNDYCEELRIAPDGKHNYAIVQAEDELAAIGMAIGANWNGARAFTATSGPGLSLMNEFLGLAYYAEVPVVLVDVQRTGPSTGMPTRVQQSDVLMAAYASHGDTKHVLLFPSNPKECFEMTAQAFDLADQLQTPVMVMTDLDLGMNDHVCPALEWDDNRKLDRGKVLSAEDLEKLGSERYGRYLDVDGDGITYRTIPATHPTKGAYVTRGTSRDEYATYTEEGPPYERNMERLVRKFETAKSYVPAPQVYNAENMHDHGIIFYGTSTHAAEEAIDLLKHKGIFLDALRIKSFPFNKTVEEFIDEHDKVFVVEQNRDSQLKSLMLIELGTHSKKLVPVVNYDGLPITADFIVKGIEKKLSRSRKKTKV
jgi:2-oxoglutarate/2-oxoacid ferredoxin oxidoreductase subunit alpha